VKNRVCFLEPFFLKLGDAHAVFPPRIFEIAGAYSEYLGQESANILDGAGASLLASDLFVFGENNRPWKPRFRTNGSKKHT
jgi:hypothetical protein